MTNNATTPWTPAIVNYLRARWPHASARVIAAEISAIYGVPITRNAIIGRTHRMELPTKKEPPKPKPEKPPRPFLIKSKPSKPLPEPPKPITEGIGFMALANQTCRWPLTGTPTRYCGIEEADMTENIPYCRYHTKKAHRLPGAA